MQYLFDFLDNKNIENTFIFKNLACSLDEANVLKFLTKGFVKGTTEFNVNEILSELYGNENYENIKKIPIIQSLIDLNLINLNTFSLLKNNTFASLEIYNSQISLSSAFLKILEVGSEEIELPDKILYNEHLEYLKDKFILIDLYQKLASLQNKNEKDVISNKIKSQAQAMEQRIEERLKLTKIEIPIENLFQEYNLEKKEQIIFLALLKEEYSSELESTREANSLICLISENNYEKIKNRILLEDSSKLLESGLIDYDEILTAFGTINRSFFINEEILQKIMHPEKDKKGKKIKLDMLINQQEIFEIIEPKTTLDDVVINHQTRELLENLLKQVDRKVINRLKTWGIKKNRRGIDAKIILYGPPGTGKTMTAISLAKSLKKRLLSFDCSKILSKYVGESEQNVRKIFDSYKDICKESKTEPVLLLNEADQFLSTRVSEGGSTDKMHNQMQNIFLEQIEKFEGVLIATTNFLSSLDLAFSRRFDYKIEFKKPDFKERLELWRRVLPESAVYEDNFSIEELAKFDLSGGQIVLVLKNTALKVAVKDEAIFTMNDFKQAINREKSGSFGDDKKVGFES